MRETLARLYLAGRFFGWATATSIGTLFAKLAPYGHEG
jgi:hypothetical protein